MELASKLTNRYLQKVVDYWANQSWLFPNIVNASVHVLVDARRTSEDYRTHDVRAEAYYVNPNLSMILVEIYPRSILVNLLYTLLHELVHIEVDIPQFPETTSHGHDDIFISKLEDVIEKVTWKRTKFPRGTNVERLYAAEAYFMAHLCSKDFRYCIGLPYRAFRH